MRNARDGGRRCVPVGLGRLRPESLVRRPAHTPFGARSDHRPLANSCRNTGKGHFRAGQLLVSNSPSAAVPSSSKPASSPNRPTGPSSSATAAPSSSSPPSQGNPIPGRDFFPLQVEYRERTYAAGKFPGGFIKRETRPSTKETLTSRLIDRPLRPLFPADYFNEVQIHATVLVLGPGERPGRARPDRGQRRPARLADPVPQADRGRPRRPGQRAARRHARPRPQMEESDLDLIVAGTRDAICMIEGFARELPEQEVGRRDHRVAHQQCASVDRRHRGAAGRRPGSARRSCPPRRPRTRWPRSCTRSTARSSASAT